MVSMLQFKLINIICAWGLIIIIIIIIIIRLIL